MSVLSCGWSHLLRSRKASPRPSMSSMRRHVNGVRLGEPPFSFGLQDGNRRRLTPRAFRAATSAFALGKTGWAEAPIRATLGGNWASGAPNGFAESRLAEVLHVPVLGQEQSSGSSCVALLLSALVKGRFRPGALWGPTSEAATFVAISKTWTRIGVFRTRTTRAFHRSVFCLTFLFDLLTAYAAGTPAPYKGS